MKRFAPSSEITGPNTCASKPVALPGMATFYSMASPGVHGAVTKCTSVTKAAAEQASYNHLRSHQGCPPANISVPRASTGAAVADAFLTALAPAEFDALSRSRRAQQQMDNALRAGAERELERKRYAAALAERQFNRVDPDNRMVAAELERRWEAALSEVRAAEEARLLQQAPSKPVAQVAIGKAFSGKAVRLAGRLPMHRLAMVNLKYVKEVRTESQGDFVVQLVDGHKVPMSRSYHSRIRELLAHA